LDWKAKCRELFNICQGLTEENAELSAKVKRIGETDKPVNVINVHGDINMSGNGVSGASKSRNDTY